MSTAPETSAPEQPAAQPPKDALTPELAKQFGLDYDPANPQSIQSVFASQFAKSLAFLNNIQATSQAETAKFRKKVTDRLTGTNDTSLSPENATKVNQMVQIFSLYPQFIGPILTTLATMVGWQQQNDKLSAIYAQINPTQVLDLLGKQQDLLRASVPYALWPENAGKTPDQIAAELAVRNGTATATPETPVQTPPPAVSPVAPVVPVGQAVQVNK